MIRRRLLLGLVAAELRAQHYDLLTWWGDGGHTPRHSAARFPDTLRWLWRDWRAREKSAPRTRNTADVTVTTELRFL